MALIRKQKRGPLFNLFNILEDMRAKQVDAYVVSSAQAEKICEELAQRYPIIEGQFYSVVIDPFMTKKYVAVLVEMKKEAEK